MTMARRIIIAGALLGGVMLATGCGPNPKDLQIQALNEEIDDLRAENDTLRSRLAMALRERDDARTRAYALEQQNADLRRELADRVTEQPGPAGWETHGEWSWVDVGSDFLFSSGKATLKPEARAKLQEIVAQINTHYADKMIWVVGHTDAEPIRVTKKLYKDNLDLSLERGATVFRALQELGITPERMIAGGQGEFHPLAPNDAKGRNKLNRRVQIVAVPKAQ